MIEVDIAVADRRDDDRETDRALVQALARREFELHYQPKASCATGRMAGAEALLRWRPGGGELRSPATFLGALERLGLMESVGRWVLGEACRQVRRWLDQGVGPVPVAVNVSGIQLQDPAFFEIVRAAIDGNGIEPRLLEIEITEDSLLERQEAVSRVLGRLCNLGVRISLDDFGTGYSSLSLLNQLPVDAIKIDRSFVTAMTRDPEAAAITRSIIGLARTLGLQTVAEGAETPGQVARLVAERCDLIQGFVYSPPVGADALAEFARADRRLSPCGPPAARCILLVDDEANILASLRRLLRADGYRILTASSAEEGLEVLAANEVDLVVSDQRMPGMTGVEFLRRVKDLRPETMRLSLSGYTDLQSITDAINEGSVYKFLTKPWDDDLIRSNIAEALRRKDLTAENRQLQEGLRHAKEQLEAANEQLRRSLEESASQMARERAALHICGEALHAVPWPILGVDEDGMIALANRSAEALLGRGAPLVGGLVEESLPGSMAAWLGARGRDPFAFESGESGFQFTTRQVAGVPHGAGTLVLGRPVP